MDTTQGPFDAEQSDEAPPPPPELEALSPTDHPVAHAPTRTPAASGLTADWSGLLRNRFILSALGIVVVLLLATIVLIAIGHGRGDTNGDPSSNVVVPGGSKTPSKPVGGLAGTATTTLSYRNGPGSGYTILGTIPKGAVVAVVGRNENESWLQVRFPVNSTLKGWVDAKLIKVEGDVTTLVIAGPGPVPIADVTYVRPVTPIEQATATEEFGTPGPTRTVRPSPTVHRTPTRTPRQFTTPTPSPPLELPSATPPLTPQG